MDGLFQEFVLSDFSQQGRKRLSLGDLVVKSIFGNVFAHCAEGILTGAVQVSLPFKDIDFINIHRLPIAEECANNCQPHGRLCRCDRHHKKDKHLTCRVAKK
jgi:hypothetical protein